MIARQQPIAGIPAYYTDSETGELVVNGRGDPATDDDVRRALNRPDVIRETDRLTLEMCEHERSQGNKTPEWLKEAETAAFLRQRRRDDRNA